MASNSVRDSGDGERSAAETCIWNERIVGFVINKSSLFKFEYVGANLSASLDQNRPFQLLLLRNQVGLTLSTAPSVGPQDGHQ